MPPFCWNPSTSNFSWVLQLFELCRSHHLSLVQKTLQLFVENSLLVAHTRTHTCLVNSHTFVDFNSDSKCDTLPESTYTARTEGFKHVQPALQLTPRQDVITQHKERKRNLHNVRQGGQQWLQHMTGTQAGTRHSSGKKINSNSETMLSWTILHEPLGSTCKRSSFAKEIQTKEWQPTHTSLSATMIGTTIHTKHPHSTTTLHSKAQSFFRARPTCFTLARTQTGFN